MGILQKRNCFRFQWRWAELPQTVVGIQVPIQKFQCSHGSLVFQGTDSRCNLYSVTPGWMLFQCLFSFGE